VNRVILQKLSSYARAASSEASSEEPSKEKKGRSECGYHTDVHVPQFRTTERETRGDSAIREITRGGAGKIQVQLIVPDNSSCSRPLKRSWEAKLGKQQQRSRVINTHIHRRAAFYFRDRRACSSSSSSSSIARSWSERIISSVILRARRRDRLSTVILKKQFARSREKKPPRFSPRQLRQRHFPSKLPMIVVVPPRPPLKWREKWYIRPEVSCWPVNR